MLLLLLCAIAGAIDLTRDLMLMETVEGRMALRDYLTELEAFLTREQVILPLGKVELMLRVIGLYRGNPTEEILRRLSQLQRSHASEMGNIVARFLREPLGQESEMPRTLADLALFLVEEDDSLFHNLLAAERRRLRKLLTRYNGVREWDVEKRSLLGQLVEKVGEAVAIRRAMLKFSHNPSPEMLWRVEKLTCDVTLLKRIDAYRRARSSLEKELLLKEIGGLWRLLERTFI